ncbi:MAG: flavin reductase family protein [Myxococcales bacterium]|nr:flavin reductase family protein [Myxococcales bacterium]
MAISSDDFKTLLGGWATGVTIVTSRVGEKIHGMTVSAFTEVSLSPPLVLVCADKSSNTHPVIAESGVFAVNILAADQADLSNRFASKKDEDKRFDGLDVETAKTGAPLLPGTVGALDCRVVAAHDAGDHVIYLGEVEEVRVTERVPLLYCRGSYGVMAAKD